MLVAIAILLIIGVLIDWAFRRVAIPGLVGLLVVGVIGGPFLLGWISPSLIALSEELRLGALIIILLRAGLEVSRESLRQVGGRVLLLAIVPAVIEGLAITLLGPPLLGLTWLESAVLGAVLAAVSPAVIVHLMLGFIDRKKGTGKGIPQMVLAASAIDDVFVIVVYGVLVGLLTGRELSLVWQLGGIPVSIALGLVVGVVGGFGLFVLFGQFGARSTRPVGGGGAALLGERRNVPREVSKLRQQVAMGGSTTDDVSGSKEISGVPLASRTLDGVPAKELKPLVDSRKTQLGSGVVAVVSVVDGKASLVVGVSDDLTGRMNAVDLVRAGSEAVGGKGGGGRPDMAQAGGPDGSAAQAAIEAIEGAIAERA